MGCKKGVGPLHDTSYVLIIFMFKAAASSQFFSLGKHKDWMYQHSKNSFVSWEQAHINQIPIDRCLIPELKVDQHIFSTSASCTKDPNMTKMLSVHILD